MARPCAPHETGAWADFLDRNFGYEKPHSYAVDFAPLFTDDALGRSCLIWKGESIVSSATLYPVTAVTPDREIKLAIVGAVATGEDYRNLGLSRSILAELETGARGAGAEGVILWSNQSDFYEKAGYAPAGKQHIYALDSLPRPDLPVEGTAVYGWKQPDVRNIYSRHELRLNRGDAYWDATAKIQSCTRVQWLSADGDVLAYIGFDRGRDLHGFIHEWGGNPAALHRLVWTVLQNRPGLLWLTHPFLVDPIRTMLDPAPLQASHLFLFKATDERLTARDLDRVWFWGLDSL